jgi:hypothetical protein
MIFGFRHSKFYVIRTVRFLTFHILTQQNTGFFGLKYGVLPHFTSRKVVGSIPDGVAGIFH